MTERLSVTPAPGALEEYAQAFDDLFGKLNQRESFRRYLEGLLLPMERNKTLTALAHTEPIVGAQHPAAQRLQWFLSESTWDPAQVNQRRLQLLQQQAHTAAHEQGALVVDETGDRKWGEQTAHVGRQYLGSLGKVENGVVSVHTLWADERVYYPVQVEPYTPEGWFEKGKHDAAFRTKPAIALELVKEAVAAGIPFRAVVADSLYGKNETFCGGLHQLGVGFVLDLPPSWAWWSPIDQPGCVEAVVRLYPWQPDAPGDWVPILRHFRDGHQEIWWALEAEGGPYGRKKSERLVVVTTDPLTLPERTTGYLTTNLPAPGSVRAATSPLAVADLAEVIRLYGLRVWVEESYKQVKQSLGWADYQVRSDPAMRRHWQLVCCAFTFCWWALSESDTLASVLDGDQRPAFGGEVAGGKTKRSAAQPSAGQLAAGIAPGASVAGTVSVVASLLAGVVGQAPTGAVTGTAGLAVVWQPP